MICYVYLIEQANSPYCKIGVSDYPAERLTQLQHKNPDRLYVRYLLEVASRADAYTLESHLHSRYAGFRRHGEWFKLKADYVVNLANMTDTMRALIVCVKEYPEWTIEPMPAPWWKNRSEYTWRMFWMFSLVLVLALPMATACLVSSDPMVRVEGMLYLAIVSACLGGAITAMAEQQELHNHNGHSDSGAGGALGEE